MAIIGFLHTAAVHVPTFAALAEEFGAQSVAVVDEAALGDARALGVDADPVHDRVREAIATLTGQGADRIVCTCSTIGALAEHLGDDGSVPVLRVDRPLAETALRVGRRIAVIAAVGATLGPTEQLLLRTAAELAIEPPPVITMHLCAEAWADFERGDLDAYLGRIARAADELGPGADVVVLAQASMAGAADRVTTPVPVLSSPRLAVAAAVAATAG